MKLGERFQAEKSDLSDADFHYEITEDTEDIRPNSLDDPKRTSRNKNDDDELVKHMSNLPSYLERGENIKEKAFSIGVLDWGRLEKWRHSHKWTVHRTGRYSTSSTSTSSSHSTEASSSHSKRGRSCSPVNQRMHRPLLKLSTSSSHSEASSSHSNRNCSYSPVNQRMHLPPLKPCAVASPDEIDDRTINYAGQKASAVEESKTILDNHLYKARMIHASNQTLKFWPRNNTEVSKTRELNAMMLQKIETSTSTHVKCDAVRSHWKGKKEVQLQDCKYDKTEEQLEQFNADISGSEFVKRPNRVVFLLPRDFPSSGKFEASQLPDSTASSEKNSSTGPSQGSIPGKHLEAVFDSKYFKIKWPISMDACQTKLPSEIFRPLPAPGRALGSPGRSRNVEMRTSNVALMNDDAGKSSKGLDPKASKASGEKVRSSSPFRRFSIGIGSIVKSSSSKEDPDSLELSCVHTFAKSYLENLESAATTTARSRSSPLRRMLDPLLKPKVSNCNHSDDPSKKNSESIDQVSRSSKKRPDSSAAHPAKAELNLISCQSINDDLSHVEKKSGSSVVQGLLRVAFKNGLPLFTFCVDNDGDILAATMKECSSLSVKDNPSRIYTFLTNQEVKKKNGSWINQGGKGKGQHCVPNIVAQMKVSDSLLSNLREFVLFAVESRKQDHHTPDFQPNNELAAIVCQIPLKLCPSSVRNEHQGAVSDNLDHEDLVNTIVILPSGVHSLPIKGRPSSLIHRWRSGGSCDCGGWDLGCQLKVLSGDHHLREKLISKVPSTADHVALFPQVDTEENLPEFTLVPFKDGIYSIEFNSSLSVLQAFSVCIAVLESRKMVKKWKDQNLSIGKSSGETMHSPNGDCPTKYVSNPPLSPVHSGWSGPQGNISQ